MANRTRYNYNRIGGSTSVTSSSPSLNHSELQDTQHMPPHSSDFQQISEESQVNVYNSEGITNILTPENLINENLKALIQLPENCPKGSKLARQKLLDTRINVKKVFLNFVFHLVKKVLGNKLISVYYYRTHICTALLYYL